MPVNRATLELIKEFEGLRLEAYPDPAHGWNVPTVGIGHTSAAGLPRVVQGMTITEAEADLILRRDLEAVEKTVLALVKVPLNENQFGALVSFTFNLGAGNLAKSTLLKRINAGDFTDAARQFRRWNMAGGKVMAGLTRRREAEAALFSKPVLAASPVPLPQPQRPATPPPPPTPPKPPVQPKGLFEQFIVWLFGIFGVKL